MCRKIDLLFFAALLLGVCGTLLALFPVSDCDQDGVFDSLITESLLLIPLAAKNAELPNGQELLSLPGFSPARLFSILIHHPPTVLYLA